jgi:hypothetical protein
MARILLHSSRRWHIPLQINSIHESDDLGAHIHADRFTCFAMNALFNQEIWPALMLVSLVSHWPRQSRLDHPLP